MTGLRKEIAKHVVLNIMETLGEDDFVTVLTFSDETRPLVECFTDENGEPELVQVLYIIPPSQLVIPEQLFCRQPRKILLSSLRRSTISRQWRLLTLPQHSPRLSHFWRDTGLRRWGKYPACSFIISCVAQVQYQLLYAEYYSSSFSTIHHHPNQEKMPPGLIHYHLLKSTTIYYHSLPSTTIHQHPLSSTTITTIHYYPLLSTTIHYHPLLSTTIHYYYHPLPTTTICWNKLLSTTIH